MTTKWEEPKDTTASDRYSLTIDTDWLEGETILTATWSANGNLIISDELIIDNVVSALFSAGDLGSRCVSVEIETATRNKTFCGVLLIKDCC